MSGLSDELRAAQTAAAAVQAREAQEAIAAKAPELERQAALQRQRDHAASDLSRITEETRAKLQFLGRQTADQRRHLSALLQELETVCTELPTIEGQIFAAASELEEAATAYELAQRQLEQHGVGAELDRPPLMYGGEFGDRWTAIGGCDESLQIWPRNFPIEIRRRIEATSGHVYDPAVGPRAFMRPY